ncbi:hypothetical protein [Bacillus changyiensis]|uniref:hypothetical protein n=1 Tax=Bacillus changyiensis TaxID=3004103 RepID=UPI0022DF9C65|nr:hypothetical protein [Bacillus changyiensis]MDA1477227.1 hypothetical protein [Bacillus changyiensis]
MNPNPVNKLGFWFATFAATFSILYSMFQILSSLGLLTGYLSQILIFGASILIAPSFVAMIACVHYTSHETKKVWSQIGLQFSVLYAVFVMIVYMTELFVVIPHGIRGESEKVALLAFEPESLMYVIDGLGYTFMCVATLFCAQVFIGDGINKWIKRISTMNGILGIPIFIVYIYFHPVLLFFGTMWMITVPSICILIAIQFRSTMRIDNKSRISYISPLSLF